MVLGQQPQMLPVVVFILNKAISCLTLRVFVYNILFQLKLVERTDYVSHDC